MFLHKTRIIIRRDGHQDELAGFSDMENNPSKYGLYPRSSYRYRYRWKSKNNPPVVTPEFFNLNARDVTSDHYSFDHPQYELPLSDGDSYTLEPIKLKVRMTLDDMVPYRRLAASVIKDAVDDIKFSKNERIIELAIRFLTGEKLGSDVSLWCDVAGINHDSITEWLKTMKKTYRLGKSDKGINKKQVRKIFTGKDGSK